MDVSLGGGARQFFIFCWKRFDGLNLGERSRSWVEAKRGDRDREFVDDVHKSAVRVEDKMPWAAARGRMAGAVWCQSALLRIEFVNDDLIRAQIGDEQKVIIGISADEV